MDSGLIAAIAAAAKQARTERGVSVAAIAAALEKTGSGSPAKVSRFESGEHFRELDRTLAVYSEVSGVSLLDLLKDAEARLKKQPATKKTAKPRGPARVKRAAKELGAATRKAQPPASGKQRPTPTKRRAG